MVLLVTLAVTGCASSGSPTPSEPTPAAPAPTTAPVATVIPALPAEVTPDTITVESTRIADAIQSLIDPLLILNVDDHSELVTKSTGNGRYFGIIRTITLDPSADAVTTATGIVATLEASGWLTAETTDQAGIYLSRIVSSEDPASAWFAVVGGDASVPGESAISLQLASPDIP